MGELVFISPRAAARMLALCLCALSACNAFDENLLTRVPQLPSAPLADGGSRPEGDADSPGAGGNVSTDMPPGPAAMECQVAEEFPSCSRPNAVTACVRDQCVLIECEPPFVDCDGEGDNGCESTLSSAENCGLCGAACALPNADTSCDDGSCTFVACQDGFGDCDEDPSTGCETPFDSLTHCGACGAVCAQLTNAAPGCAAGVCGVGQCLGPFGDCNADAADGCEQSLANDAHCGGCDAPCMPQNAAGSCATGQCALSSCTPGFEDCNGLAPDGCEASLTSAASCGACGAACELPLRATAVACSAAPAGCVVDHACATASPGCVPGAPETGCETGYADCDGDGRNGCEVALGTLSNCGACGDRCGEANSVAACDNGMCQRIDCLPGYDDCGSGTCDWLGSATDDCGACDEVCSGGTASCFGGDCTDQICAEGTADCNATAGDGCETTLIDNPDHCGQCGLRCGPYPNATATCSSSSQRCAIGTCDAGFLDCNGFVHDGCEVDARTIQTCGSCGDVCALPYAEESCSTGRCELVGCDPGRANCDGDAQNGCEVDTALPETCGSCTQDCTGRPNTQTGGCSEDRCVLVCKDGFRDCDGDAQNGCEAAFGTPQHCGACGNDCTALPNVQSASCGDAVCTSLVCDPGFADCDGVSSNGCERSTRTLTDCGACDVPCALPSGTTSCSTGSCTLTGCSPGYGNCDGSPNNGCETSLNDPDSCGGCNNACPAGSACENGRCMCSSSDQCGSPREECCGGVCVDTQSQCSFIVCLPLSSSRDVANCGRCGNHCLLTTFQPFCCAN